MQLNLPFFFMLFFAGQLLFAQDSIEIHNANQATSQHKIKQYERTVIIHAKPDELFSFMDNIENTGMHMTENNAQMMGGKLTIDWLSKHKTGLGAKYRWTGKVLGMKLDFTSEVSKWVEGKEKVWGTIGDPKLIVLSWFEMYLYLTPLPDGTTQTQLGIYYTKPKASLLGFLLGRSYAKWCVKSMLKDTQKHFK